MGGQSRRHDDVEWIAPWAPPSEDMDVVRADSGADCLESNYFSLFDELQEVVP